MDSVNSIINVLFEMERIGYSFEPLADNEIKCLCPFHKDKSPSCCINIEKKVFTCKSASCNMHGDFVTFLAGALKTTRVVVVEDLKTRYDFEETKPISPELVEKYHIALKAQEGGVFKKALLDRGINEDLIVLHRLGFYDGRITIPIANIHGTYVNIRRYLPGAPGRNKFRNTRGHGASKLYPIKQLQYDNIVICAGELKAIAAAYLLNIFGIGAITTTAGEDNWEDDFTKSFIDKTVWVCFDVDKGGEDSANKLAARLKGSTKWVGKVRLTNVLDIDKYPKGDISDWIGKEQATGQDIKNLLDATPEWRQPKHKEDTTKPIQVHLSHATLAIHTKKKLITKGVVAALNDSPFIIPKVIRTSCTKNQDGCATCRVFPKVPDENGFIFQTISSESPAIMEMVNTPKDKLRQPLLDGCEIGTCKSVELKPVEFYNVYDARLAPQLEVSSRQADRIMTPALCVDKTIELNEAYEFVATMLPHHKTQESVLLISECTPVQDALSTYQPSEEELSRLCLFQPTEWTLDGIETKLDALYADLSANVTHIYERQAMHVAVDLAYHSPLVLQFDKREVKGWVEILILGDSAQGKSETALGLQRHYGLGEKLEMKNATVAGILGGLQKFGDKFMVTWGVIPTHDKRLVILEELKGAPVEIIAKLTDMRSSGIAEIPKIERRRAHARTRLLALSNPRSTRQLSAYNHGVEAVTELIGNPEDVRRFDAVFIVSNKDIAPGIIDDLQRHRPEILHVHTSKLCHSLVLWAWTREKVEFEHEAFTEILDSSTQLCKRFVDSIPIVDSGSMRFKLARLCASLAARTFSIVDNVLTVRKCHVEYIVKLLEEQYSKDTFGYLDYSQAEQQRTRLLDPHLVENAVAKTPYPKDFIAALLGAIQISTQDVSDWTSYDQIAARELVSLLVRKKALERSDRHYRKTSAFIVLLKNLQHTVQNRPDYVGEGVEQF